LDWVTELLPAFLIHLLPQSFDLSVWAYNNITYILLPNRHVDARQLPTRLCPDKPVENTVHQFTAIPTWTCLTSSENISSQNCIYYT
jgi:hypothetical protein